MDKVTVYKVDFEDISTDAFTRSKRMATTKGAEQMRGGIVKGAGVESDASQLEPGEEWTPRNLNPQAIHGFQKSVTG